MKHKLTTALAALACAAFVVAIAPTTPTAIAGNGNGHHGGHYDEEAQQWYDFAHDKAIEINHLSIRTHASIERKADYAIYHIMDHCCIEIAFDCNDEYYKRIRKSIARRAKFKIGKCVWEAQMDLEACYTDARAQLEAAGYGYFLHYIYSPYRTVQGNLVRAQREANKYIDKSTYCRPY